MNLTPTALRYLSSLHVLPKLLSRGANVSNIDIISLSSASRLASISLSKPEYRFQGLRIKRQDLTDGMIETLHERGRGRGSVVWGKKVVEVKDVEEEGTVEVVFADGETARGDLAVGCDGIHSPTRLSYVEPQRKEEYTGICVGYGFLPSETVKSELPFKDTALFSSQAGSLIASYCTAEHDTLFLAGVMKVPEQEGREGWRVKGEDREEVKRDTLRRFGPYIVQERVRCVREMLEGVEEVCLYPVSVLPQGGRWAKGRVLLLGDAAHAMPPQGESTGFCIEDAVLFAHVLERRGPGSAARARTANGAGGKEGGHQDEGGRKEMDIEELCRYFEELRKPRMEEAVKESLYRFKGAHGGGWFAFKIQELLTPWILWWVQKKRDEEFCADVRTMDV